MPPPLALALLALLALLSGPAAGERAGAFDHYMLALSWSPSWCRAEGAGRGAEQCAPGGPRGFIVHGLWPQREDGWPEFCQSAERPPSRAETAAMADVMGSAGLAWFQWRKHGTCSGLSARAYFRLLREANARIRRPAALTAPGADARIDPQAVEAAFLRANPGLAPEGVTVTCRDGLLREVRICLDRELQPRACGAHARRDCRAGAVDLPAAR